MADPHSLPPPPGGDRNRAPETYGAVISLTILSTSIVIVRMYTRVKIVHSVGWDDHTMVLSQVMNLTYFVFQIMMSASGVGRHMYYLPLETIVTAGLYYHIVEVLYVLTTAVIKVSACLFLLRIMSRGTTQRLRWSLYALMGGMFFVTIATAIVILVQCIPIQAGWDPRIKGKCWSIQQALGIGYTQNAWSVFSDLVCSTFPIVILRKLQISKNNKYALFFVMSLGILSAICCIIKMFHLSDLTRGDFTWNGVTLNLWASLEQNLGIIACSIPTLQPLFRSLSERMTQGSQAKSGLRNSHVLPAWNKSGTNKFGSRNRTFHSIQNVDTHSDSEDQILAADDGKGIRKTTDVELFYQETPVDAHVKDKSVESA